VNIDIKKRDIAAYALLPGVLPRMRQLFGSGFSWIAYMVALVFQATRLLPPRHPYLNPKNQGQYNIINVLRAAGANIEFKWRNIDQIAIFGVVIGGIFLFIAQVLMLIFYYVLGVAHAQGVGNSAGIGINAGGGGGGSPGLFETINPQSDAAFMMLDYVFGIPGFFGSCALGTPTGQTIYPCENIPEFGADPVLPFHAGLHSLLEFYSWSILFVAVLIFVYYVVVVAAETAQTGVPLGARFNKAWAPIRMCLAIGLLVPIVYGLNSGQYIVLGVAKLGSGLATNGWYIYNDTVTAVKADSTPMGEQGTESLIPKPNLPDAAGFIASMQLIQTCRIAYRKAFWDNDDDPRRDIRPYAVKPGAAPIDLSDMSGEDVGHYEEILDFYDRGNVLIRFGAPDETSNEPGQIVPYCGDMIVPTTVTQPYVSGGNNGAAGAGAGGGAGYDAGEERGAGAWAVQRTSFGEILLVWRLSNNIAQALRWVEYKMGPYHRPCMISDDDMSPTRTGGSGDPILEELASQEMLAQGFSRQASGWWSSNFDMGRVDAILGTESHSVTPSECYAPPGMDVQDELAEELTLDMETNVDAAWYYLTQIEDLFALDDEVRIRGWVAAGMWYNRIAQVVGQEAEAVINMPYMKEFPIPMKKVRETKGYEDISMVGAEIYNPEIGNKESIELALGDTPFAIAQVLYENYANWMKGSVSNMDLSVIADTNVIKRVMHGIFGTKGLMEIRAEENKDVHPMSLLVGIGKDLVDSTLRNVLASTGFSIAGGLYGAFDDQIHAGFLNAMSSAFSTVAFVGLTVGFLLYYVLPFMPFLYFFFAAGTWVKSIFEAMVGVPLWALAHLRIDGEGLPGDAASNGYFLILEIFIRPILIVFGLIASFTIFGAMIRILHEIFALVVDNVLGHGDDNLNIEFGAMKFTMENKREIIDEFFFTIIYTMAVYITGLSCFKLIDLIPNSILRWGGSGTKSFGDTSDDPAEGLTQYAAMGGYMVGQRLVQGIGQAGKGVGQGLGAAMEADGQKPPDLFDMVAGGGGKPIQSGKPAGQGRGPGAGGQGQGGGGGQGMG
jgi:hypothetical protein